MSTAAADQHGFWSCLQVLDECHKAMAWLKEKQAVQDSKRKTEDPELLTSDIKKKEETLVRFADPIVNKPAPKPVSIWSSGCNVGVVGGLSCAWAGTGAQSI